MRKQQSSKRNLCTFCILTVICAQGQQREISMKLGIYIYINGSQNPNNLWCFLNFACSATLSREVSQPPLDRMAPNSSFIVLRFSILVALGFIWHHSDVDIGGFESNISTALGRITMKFGTLVIVPPQAELQLPWIVNCQRHTLRVFVPACLNSGQLSLQSALTRDSGSFSSSFPLSSLLHHVHEIKFTSPPAPARSLHYSILTPDNGGHLRRSLRQPG